jgi:hypothetical protein
MNEFQLLSEFDPNYLCKYRYASHCIGFANLDIRHIFLLVGQLLAIHKKQK